MNDDDRQWKPPWGLMYAGMAFGVLANVFIVVLAFDGQLNGVIPVGNVAAVFILIGAAWLIRARQKGRL